VSTLITTERINQLSASTFQDVQKLDEIEATIALVEDMEERENLYYFFVDRLIHEKLLDVAEKNVRLMKLWTVDQVVQLGKIASKRFQQGQKEKSLSLLQEALSKARINDCAWQKAESLKCLAGYYFDIEKRRKSIELLCEAAEVAQKGESWAMTKNEQQDAIDSASVLGDIAVSLNSYHEGELALRIANSIHNTYIKNRTITIIKKS
jgi:hypothetical protein